jgi:hypothetical protein
MYPGFMGKDLFANQRLLGVDRALGGLGDLLAECGQLAKINAAIKPHASV